MSIIHRLEPRHRLVVVDKPEISVEELTPRVFGLDESQPDNLILFRPCGRNADGTYTLETMCLRGAAVVGRQLPGGGGTYAQIIPRPVWRKPEVCHISGVEAPVPDPEPVGPGRATAFDAFCDLPRWVAWKAELRNGKPTKVPYSPHNGGKAKANDPRTWGTRAEAEARAKQLVNGEGSGGIGIELGDLGNGQCLMGLDLDSCLDEAGGLAPWAEKILAYLDTYAERSPSGRGLKAFLIVRVEDARPFLGLLGIDPDRWGTKRAVDGDAKDHGPAVEVYCAERYFTVTGQRWPDRPDVVGIFDWSELEELSRVIPANGNGVGRSGDGRDDSRSALTFRKAAELLRAGQIETFEEMVEALRRYPDRDIRDWVREKGEPNGMRELWRIWGKIAPAGGVSLSDFYAYMPKHSYIYGPTGEMWPAASVNARIPPVPLLDAAGKPELDENDEPVDLKANVWLDRKKPVEQMTWAPGLPQQIHGRLTSEGGWIERPNVSCYNSYRPPQITPGDPKLAKPWVDHVYRVYPDDTDHIIKWLAHRVQHPEEKINHALFLGGAPGIGKDTILEPVKRAVGPWNWSEISPRHLFETYNGFARAVVLRVSEARDLGEASRYQFYDHMKVYTAAPPDVHRVNTKYIPEHYVVNCCGVIITSNYKVDGIYLPADDRRHYVAWSPRSMGDFEPGYWDALWEFYDRGGDRHVAAYLRQLDLSGFNPKAPPPKTAAFWEIANANRAPEDAELADAFDALGDPPAVTLSDLIGKADSREFGDWLRDRRHRRIVGHRIEACGYTAVRNPDAKDGLWKVEGRRQAIYANAALPLGEQLSAAQARAQAETLDDAEPKLSKEDVVNLKDRRHPPFKFKHAF